MDSKDRDKCISPYLRLCARFSLTDTIEMLPPVRGTKGNHFPTHYIRGNHAQNVKLGEMHLI